MLPLLVFQCVLKSNAFKFLERKYQSFQIQHHSVPSLLLVHGEAMRLFLSTNEVPPPNTGMSEVIEEWGLPKIALNCQ